MKRIRVPVLSLSMGKKRFRAYPGAILMALKGADAVGYGGLKVGAKPLRELLKCLEGLDGPLELKANGRLEVKNIPYKGKGPKHWFAIEPGAWLPEEVPVRWGHKPKAPQVLVVLVPRMKGEE